MLILFFVSQTFSEVSRKFVVRCFENRGAPVAFVNS